MNPHTLATNVDGFFAAGDCASGPKTTIEAIARTKGIDLWLLFPLGIGVNRLLTKELGVEGVLLLKVEPGSAADAAGLRGTTIERDGNVIAGDVIIALDGQAVDSVATLLARLDDHQIGDRITLRIWRAGREFDVDVVLQGGS